MSGMPIKPHAFFHIYITHTGRIFHDKISVVWSGGKEEKDNDTGLRGWFGFVGKGGKGNKRNSKMIQGNLERKNLC